LHECDLVRGNGGNRMNNVVLIGRLTKDPEVKYIPQSETAVANFTLAVDRPMTKEKKADFIRIVCFGKTAEICERYLTKGRLIGIQGRIQTGSYKTSTGETRYTTDVYADRVKFLDWGEKKNGIPDGFEEVEGFAMLDDDDEIPF
jgi:single-strand DNA-binding protein